MKRNNEWLNNRNATKNAKVFNITVIRNEQGKLELLGDHTLVLDRSKGSSTWERVNTRDFGKMLNKQGVNFR